jgi:hypothetical protein
MVLYLYDNAIKLCGEENTYVFPIHDVLTLGETRNLIAGLRHEYEELTR